MFGEYFSVGNELGAFNKFRKVKGSAETDGKFVEFEEAHTGDCGNGIDGCASSKCAPPYHIHTRQVETFEVKSGTFQYVIEGEVKLAAKGAKLTVPAGVKHTFCRGPDMSDNETLAVRFTLSPALNSEMFFPNFVGIFNDAKMNPNPIHVIWLVCSYDMRLADIPWLLHEVMCLSFDLVAPLLGYRTEYPEYASVLRA